MSADPPTSHGAFEAPPLPLLQAMHTSLNIRWGTDAPFAIGPVSAERIGYAQDPCVVFAVHCRAEDTSALVPIVRQRLYGELAERGWTPDDVEFTPGVAMESWRRRRFFDENDGSPTHGRAKMGQRHQFRFRMSERLAAATFVAFGSFAKLPNNPEREAWSALGSGLLESQPLGGSE